MLDVFLSIADSISLCKYISSNKWLQDDPYSNFNVFGYAYLYEALSNEALGNMEEAKDVRLKCEKKYPKWYRFTAMFEEAKNLGE